MHYLLDGKKLSAKKLTEESIRLNYFDKQSLEYESMRAIEDMFVEFGHKLLLVKDDGSYEILHESPYKPKKLFLGGK